jgi:prepilin-type N-terminal cleavage/methylation domain-containing protein
MKKAYTMIETLISISILSILLKTMFIGLGNLVSYDTIKEDQAIVKRSISWFYSKNKVMPESPIDLQLNLNEGIQITAYNFNYECYDQYDNLSGYGYTFSLTNEKYNSFLTYDSCN